MTREEAQTKAVEVEAAAEERGALWKRIYASPQLPGKMGEWSVFGETHTGLRYRWNELDGRFYYWGA